jgi:hypothetical protein
MITLRNEDDFKRYKHRLDIGEKYEHEHIGEPVRYPAKVESRDCDDGNTRASYQHRFIYKDLQKMRYSK